MFAGEYQTEEIKAYIDGDALRFVESDAAWISAKNPVEISN